MSIQPVNKAAEHLINSTLVLEKEKEKQSMLIIQRTVGGGGNSRKDWAEYYVTVHPM